MHVATIARVAALFPRWTNAPYAVAIGALIAIAACAVVGPMIFIRTPYGSDRNAAVVQPVGFDHRHHARDDGIDCLYCHPGAERTASAGIPATDVCMGCHGQVWPDSAELQLVRQSWATNTAIPWRRVYALPDHVYFNHSVHVHYGIACARCHGAVEDMPRVERVTPLTMGWCIDCHRQPPGRAKSYAVTQLTTCSACHR